MLGVLGPAGSAGGGGGAGGARRSRRSRLARPPASTLRRHGALRGPHARPGPAPQPRGGSTERWGRDMAGTRRAGADVGSRGRPAPGSTSAVPRLLPEAATVGPSALARAPRLRSVPMTVPFCPGEPEGQGRDHQVPAGLPPAAASVQGRASHRSRRPQKTGRAPRPQRLAEDISEAPVSSEGRAVGL